MASARAHYKTEILENSQGKKMRSVKLTIEGNFWDSQIYSGELILFDISGSLHRIMWGQIIDELAIKNAPIQTAMRVAFSDSDLFYNPKVRKVLFDPSIKAPIQHQLSALADLQIAINYSNWRTYWHTESTPFNFLSTDTEIYYNTIFAGGDEGLFSFPRQASSSKRFSKEKLTKHHDASIFQVKASERFTAVATASGSDGLFDFSFSRNSDSKLSPPRTVAGRPCNACDWAFQSIMGWSAGDAFLASFKEEKAPDSKKKIRVFDRIINQTELFSDSHRNSFSKNHFSWGSRDKIYQLSDNGIQVSSYNADNKKKTKQSKSTFSDLGFLPIDFKESEVISTGTTPFGTVIELADALLVVRSDGEIERFPEEPVHWRVFPRSEHYSNQLHIIYDDRALIVSYVHDYFVDQSAKLSGFSKGKAETGDIDESLRFDDF